LRKTSTNY